MIVCRLFAPVSPLKVSRRTAKSLCLWPGQWIALINTLEPSQPISNVFGLYTAVVQLVTGIRPPPALNY
jgi:hypothetical protein